jgi:hypothetical protein
VPQNGIPKTAAKQSQNVPVTAVPRGKSGKSGWHSARTSAFLLLKAMLKCTPFLGVGTFGPFARLLSGLYDHIENLGKSGSNG